tara:strand:+ start:655 stop:1074 length:420 start_codon:yes stop_codon:yes gene_type:complete
MGLFSKEKKTIDPNSMTPIQVITHLFVLIQISDNQISYEEKLSWLSSIKTLFPDMSEERANFFYDEATELLNTLDTTKKDAYLEKILNVIPQIISKDLTDKLGPEISTLIKSDGIIMTSEIEIAKKINTKLSIDINVNE